jgi:hypothetical protein
MGKHGMQGNSVGFVDNPVGFWVVYKSLITASLQLPRAKRPGYPQNDLVCSFYNPVMFSRRLIP